ncbi:hypothetical protein FDP41_002512 [Naegleria fowleri]|uniref:FMR1-interacting protein 1 conserved domain-containing protein n=1 Tax=Naegleria fowleri TaxID=5763 RepID=A0A6A5BVQ2_NAEFO|nr:uncharacterized protein FDP41_002512 [Naegleria fowleri]KAF0978692.1 hypothetical protein FDP41_002512 [Naegleria fowleri]
MQEHQENGSSSSILTTVPSSLASSSEDVSSRDSTPMGVAACSSPSNAPPKTVHPQAWLQAMYSAGRGGLQQKNTRGGYHRGRGNRGRGSRGRYNNNNRYNRGESRKRPKDDDEKSNEESDNEKPSSDLNEENVPEYIKFLQDYKKNYKNPIFSMLYKKPMETPEDIEKYREERRKNYPTRQNVIEKEKELSERRKKGEIIIGASEKVKSLLKVMGIEKDKKEESNQDDSNAKAAQSLIRNLLTQEISQDKIILLQCFRHIIHERFYCSDDELSEEVKSKIDKLHELTKIEMKKLEEFRKKKLGLLDEELNANSETSTSNAVVSEKATTQQVLEEAISDEEFGELSDDAQNDEDMEDDILGNCDASEEQKLDTILKEITE